MVDGHDEIRARDAYRNFRMIMGEKLPWTDIDSVVAEMRITVEVVKNNISKYPSRSYCFAPCVDSILGLPIRVVFVVSRLSQRTRVGHSDTFLCASVMAKLMSRVLLSLSIPLREHFQQHLHDC